MELLRYLLLTSLYAMGMWAIYVMTLRNSVNHTASRSYLLASIVLTPLLPLLSLPQRMAGAIGYAVSLPEFTMSSQATAQHPATDFLPWIYFCVSGGIALCFTIGYTWLGMKLRQGRAEPQEGYTLVHGTGIGPGTLGRRIFLPGAQTEEGILRHEIGHIRAGHRYDLMLLSLSRMLLWISPAHWLLARELRVVHEFEADRIATRVVRASDYTALLLCEKFNIPSSVFSHSFFHHPLKRRIMMLQKHANRGAGKMLAAAVLLTAGFAGSVVIAQTKSNGSVDKSIAALTRTPLETGHLQRSYGQPAPGTVSKTFDGRILLSKVDQMPQFDGNMYKWLTDNVRSPEKEMQGKVVVQFTVDASGTISQPYIQQSSKNQRLDAEALRVISSMPTWKPGKQNGVAVPVLFTLPFNFGHLGEGC